jgi:hypothetical protein
MITAGGTTYDECISVTGTGHPPPPASKSDNVDYGPARGATPFTVYTEFDCSPVGIDNAQKIATDALAQTAPWQVERTFWTGLSGGQAIAYPHLAATAQVLDAEGIVLQSAATTVTGSGAATDIALGLGVLEEQLANCYNGVGVIHVPVKALPTLVAWDLVIDRGAQLTTKNGNLIAVGSGYPGSSPAGVPAVGSTTWFFATGAVFAYVSPVRVFNLRESIDRSENTVKMIAERTYLLGWDCCHAAVQVDLGVPIGT